MAFASLVLAAWLGFGFAAAQFPPQPKGVLTVQSKVHENVSISYKEVGNCIDYGIACAHFS